MVFNIQEGTFKMINPFLTNPPNLSALKTPENQRFSVIFKGNEREMKWVKLKSVSITLTVWAIRSIIGRIF